MLMEDKELLVYKIKINEFGETVKIPIYYEEEFNLDNNSPIIGMNGHGKGGFLRSKDIQETLKPIDEENI